MNASQAACLRAALQVGHHLLDQGASALTVVEQTIRALEKRDRLLFWRSAGLSHERSVDSRFKVAAILRLQPVVQNGC